MREVGYSRATTRAIAHAAGVTEGTIYRHFPDKTTMFFAAALGPHEEMLVQFDALPALAGTSTVAENLSSALRRLAQLRADIVPLELAIMTDPELASARATMQAGPLGAGHGGPPERLAEYLASEQQLGRLRADLDPHRAASIILALLFALALQPPDASGDLSPAHLDDAVDLLVRGLAP
ncbi:hypothetical protein CTE05_13030 [Cellulomonas terrae]|uniref:HTH tetR-type domain-containing protein n=1 Tax=Cellulomonas terrae TaxID=311234 RepID=A0A511JII5_9CELL|nr:hypothetical protein CTE05_13030 [Cellulomonas terrae]